MTVNYLRAAACGLLEFNPLTPDAVWQGLDAELLTADLALVYDGEDVIWEEHVFGGPMTRKQIGVEHRCKLIRAESGRVVTMGNTRHCLEAALARITLTEEDTMKRG